MYDLNFDNRYEDEWDKMMRNRDPSRDVPFTHLDGCEGKVFRFIYINFVIIITLNGKIMTHKL